MAMPMSECPYCVEDVRKLFYLVLDWNLGDEFQESSLL